MSSTGQVATTTPSTNPTRAWLALTALLLSLAASAYVQWEWMPQQWLASLPALWGAAAVLGAVAWKISSPVVAADRPPQAPLALAPGAARVLISPLVLTAFSLTLAGVVLLYRDLLSTAGIALWAGGLVALPTTLALAESSRRTDSQTSNPPPSRAWLWRLALLAVLLLALVARLYRLDEIPAKYLDDEGAVADWGLNYLHGTPVFGQHLAAALPLFRNGTTAYPLLGSYVHALVMQVAGETVFGSRLTAVIAGVLCVAVIYAFLADCVQRWAALAGAFLLALCHTHLYWSRSGIPQSMTTTTVAAFFWLTLRGTRTGSFASFALAGLLLGLAQYFYEGARFFVPVLVVFFLVRAVVDRGFLRGRGLQVALMALTAALVFAPIGFWYLQNPNELLARSRGVLIFAQPDYIASRYPGLDTTGVVLAQLRRGLEGFAYRGDGSNFFSLRGPIIDPVSRVLLLSGIFAIFAIRDRARFLVFLWIWVPIAIVCIPTVDPPSMTRLIQVVPALFIVAGLMLDRLGRVVWHAAGRAGASVFAVLVPAALIWGAAWDMGEFFGRYPHDHVADAQTLGGKLAAAAPRTDAIRTIGEAFSFYAPSVRFLARGHAGDDLPNDGIPLPGRGTHDALVFVGPDAQAQIAKLRATYPAAVEAEHRNERGDLLLHSFHIPAAALNAALADDATWAVPDARIGLLGNRLGEFAEPHALAVDSHGNLFVGDTGNRRLAIVDPSGKPISIFAAPGSAASAAVGAPVGLAFLGDGSLLVLARDPLALKRYTTDGAWIADVPVEGLRDPSAIAAAPGGFYIADADTNQLLHVDMDGAVVGRVGGRGSEPGQFIQPTALASSLDGTVYVFDSGNHRVQRFSKDLVYETAWPLDVGSERLGQFLAVGPSGAEHVYVANPRVGAVQRFTTDGHFESLVGLKGDYPGNLAWPVAVALDAEGDVYIADDARGQIFRYDLSRLSALTRQN